MLSLKGLNIDSLLMSDLSLEAFAITRSNSSRDTSQSDRGSAYGLREQVEQRRSANEDIDGGGEINAFGFESR
jgi:hypothetical protein